MRHQKRQACTQLRVFLFGSVLTLACNSEEPVADDTAVAGDGAVAQVAAQDGAAAATPSATAVDASQTAEDGGLPPSCRPASSADPAGALPPCQARAFTIAACNAAGGIAIADPGDGSLTRDGCPRALEALGTIDADWDEGGLCCKRSVLDCAPQRARFTGSCEPAPRFVITSAGCVSQTGCACLGTDCDKTFSSLEACEAANAGCAAVLTRCGGFQGNTCSADEFCAYRELAGCGFTDGSASCQPRPESCTDELAPVCGCDGKTYATECEANRAGQGVLSFGECAH